jgi:hypothetical protein
MSDTFINVHTYDGKLNNIFVSSKSYTIKDKKDSFLKLVQLLTSSSAIKTVQVMIGDLDKKNGDNFQIENNIDSSDILIELIQWIDNQDLLKSIDEQLSDAQNLGICPSGRCTRLLQLWVAYKP